MNTWLCVERGRLQWVAKNQKVLKADKYKNFIKDLDDCIDTIGQQIILPSSFIGGPRHMRGLYQDSMACTREFGPPSVFITMTANPQWAELQNELRFDEVPSDRPELGVRVFKMKLDMLIEDLTKKHVLGKFKSWVYVVEFQKRGLPHIHFLGIFEEKDMPKTETDVDDLVCAEIPDPVHEPSLHELVKTHMLHGPCGPQYDTPCRGSKGCSKFFPKMYQAKTILPENSYPAYKRQKNSHTINKRGFIFDNSRVIPYNKYLLLRYQCHINVEIPHGIHAYKYLYKYITKGHDRTKVEFEIHDSENVHFPACEVDFNEPKQLNEMKTYINGRWVSAYEGEIFCFRRFYIDVSSYHLITLSSSLETVSVPYVG